MFVCYMIASSGNICHLARHTSDHSTCACKTTAGAPPFHNTSEMHSDCEPTQGAVYPIPLQSEHLGDAGVFVLLGPLLSVREIKLIMGDCRQDPEENLRLTPGEKLTAVNKVHMCTGREGCEVQNS